MKQKALSNLEQEVMNIVWEHPESSVRDVMTKLTKNKKLAYPTVATILRRLDEKGFVTKNTKEMTFFYTPKVSKEKYSTGLASSFIKKFVQSFGNMAMSSFAESIDELPREKRDYFLKLLNEHESK